MKGKLSIENLLDHLKSIENSNEEYNSIYPGVLAQKQPVHTVYGGAHLFSFDVVQKLGRNAKNFFLQYAPDPIFFAKNLELKGSQWLPESPQDIKELTENISKNYPAAYFAKKVWTRVLEKLENEAVEDFRIDFEDGFGVRSDDEEDNVAKRAAEEVAKGMEKATLPPFLGIRIKSFDKYAKRSITTLDIFLKTLLDKGNGLPENFVITFPKIAILEHVEIFVEVLEKLEKANDLPKNSLKVELMVELTQTIINQKGETHIWNLVKATKGRCRGLHFGTYDYTASCDITSHQQAMDNPVCDFAKHIMQISAMGTGLMISDGATNIFPIPVYPKSEVPAQIAENVRAIYNSWKIQFSDIQHSLRAGFYQGWDLHPAQLPIRYAACYAFYLEDYQRVFQRMKNFLDISGQATLVDNVFDDAATGQGLINFFLKSYNCGAITKKDLAELHLTPETLQTRSFPKIITEYKKASENR